MREEKRRPWGGDPMIVISLDAVGTEDLPFLKSLPNFGDFWREAAVCERVRSVYPSLTYPAHTTIVTGKYPANHGIVNNLRIQPQREKPDWFWQRRFVRGETLYDLLRERGGRTAALLWPVTGKARIRWNLPEVLPNRPWQNQITASFFNGSPLYELRLERKFGHLREGVRQPQLDDFVQASLLDTLKNCRPDLTLVHFTDVDSCRHLHGVKSPQAEEALRRHDRRLGEIFSALETLGLKDRANVVILGDHYQMDVDRAVCLNWYFARAGWLSGRDGRVLVWKVLARECDGSCYVYVRDRRLIGPVRELLERLLCRGLASRIYTGREAAALGADGSCAFMVEGGAGVYYQNRFDVPEIRAGAQDGAGTRNGSAARNLLQKATHGFYPGRPGYTTIFGGRGPAFRPGARVETMGLVDEGPTLAAALGMQFSRADGKIQKNLLFISGN